MKTSTRLLILVASIIVVTMVLNLLVLSNQVRTQLELSQAEWVETLTFALKEGITRDTINGNKLPVSELLINLVENDDAIEYAFVTDMDSELFAHSFRGGIPRFIADDIAKYKGLIEGVHEDKIYHTQQGIIVEVDVPLIEGLSARLHLGLNSSEVNALLGKVTQSMIWVIVPVGILGFILALILGHRINRPLVKLTDQLHNLAESKTTDLPDTKSSDPDIRQMVASFQSVIRARNKAEKHALEREQNLSLTLDSIGDGVIVTDAAGLVTRMNFVAEQLTGWRLKNANGLHLDKVFPIVDETTREKMETPVKKVLSTGNVVTLANHTTLISKSGSEFQIADSAAPIRDKQQNILGVILVFHDITEQYQLRETAARSAQRLADAQRMAHIGNWELDHATNNLEWSEEIYRIFEIDKDEFGASYEAFLDIIHPEDREKVNSAYAESLKNKIPYSIEHRLRMPDGRIKYVFEQCESFFDNNGNPLRSTGTVQDITEQVNSEAKLRYNEARLVESQQIAHLGSWDTDIETGETNWSEEMYRLLGYEPYEVKARPENFYARVHKDDLAHLKHELERPFREKNSEYHSEFRVALPDNSIRILTETGKIIYNKEGKPWRYVGTSLDITERRDQEEKLRRSQKMDALGKLTGGIAHDYNNLLGIIMGYAEQLNDNLSHDKKLGKYAQDIQRAAERGTSLTKKLLGFSRQRILETKILDINTLLSEQQLMLEKTMTARVNVTYDLNENLWPVELDSNELADVIINLCVNAQHAMEKGGKLALQTSNEQLKTVDAKPLGLDSGDYVLLSISDTGSGMDATTKEKIFDPFFTTKGERGTGLGLSQVYGFVERSGGTITVYSEPGHGSRFVLYFPRSQEALTEIRAKSTSTTQNLRGHETLLVVDDEQALTELAHEILSAQGYDVITASGGAQALEILGKNNKSVTLVISDVIMPVMDGYQLANEIQNLYPDIKLQLISGFSDERHNQMADRTLQKNTLHKPYTANKLLTRVRHLLDEENNKQATNTQQPKKSLSGKTIMVMDDEENVRELFKLNLEKLGHTILEACDGNEAIALYQRSLEKNQIIDAVIMDLSIPGSLGGKEVADKILNMNPHARLIVSSGNSTGPEMMNFREHGFDAALEKTFDRETIKQVLEKVLL